MTPLLEAFLAEAREGLQSIGERLMQLEASPADAEVMTALFRTVHTLKGNSGLFEFPEMTRVLHAAEDLMDAVRHGRVPYSRALADRLLDAMDFVGVLCEEVEGGHEGLSTHAAPAVRLAEQLRALLPTPASAEGAAKTDAARAEHGVPFESLPAELIAEAMTRAASEAPLHWIEFAPAEDCFFQGDDPVLQARRTPGLRWATTTAREGWAALDVLDPYRCVLDFQIVSDAPRAALDEHFRFVAEQVRVIAVKPPGAMAAGAAGAASADVDAETWSFLAATQREILLLPVSDAVGRGRRAASIATLRALAAGCAGSVEAHVALGAALDTAIAHSEQHGSADAIVAWLDGVPASLASSREARSVAVADGVPTAPVANEGEPRLNRRADDGAGALKSLRVDQAKIDRLMNLIGEMVVAKNGLPYLAGRAEAQYGVRELSREIKTQYSVINRIAEEMQDAIMQVRMMPVSFVFQRFPRLVRDTSRKLEKDVTLVMSGEDTEADKNIIEALSDPLVHIVRNSLDHGIEDPETRRAAGKPTSGTLSIRASQEADRVVIDIRDDGKGIDPQAVAAKAVAQGLISADDAARMSEQEAVNLVFLPGFSTKTEISDLSGRGVGMDVVRTAVERVNGTVTLTSQRGTGTQIRLSLPLSMAVTNVIVVESDGQVFGMPMENVVETVRVPRGELRTIKQRLATVLRGRVVPLEPINGLLGLSAEPLANDDDELAVLVVRSGDDTLGLLVDDFRETMDIIVKPLTGVLAGIAAYAGSALLGDGSVLMVLNAREMLR